MFLHTCNYCFFRFFTSISINAIKESDWNQLNRYDSNVKGISEKKKSINMGNYLIIIVCLLLSSNFYVQTIIGANIANVNTNVNDETSATTTTTTTTLGAVNSTKSTRNRQIHNNNHHTNNGTTTTSFKGKDFNWLFFCLLIIPQDTWHCITQSHQLFLYISYKLWINQEILPYLTTAHPCYCLLNWSEPIVNTVCKQQQWKVVKSYRK